MTRRNIVLVTYDSLRADHCGYAGYDRNTTPNLDELVSAGTAFTNAISPASRTNPSMAGILTGKSMVARDRVAKPEIARNHLKRYGTVAETLSDQEYATGAFCPNAYASRHYGFDRGFDHFEDFLFSTNRYQKLFRRHLSNSSFYTVVRNFRNYLRREEAFKSWDRYIDQVERWARNADEPFFLWVFSLDTHFPHLTPRKHRQWSSLFDQYYYNWRCNRLIDDLAPDMTEQEIRKIVDIYDDSIRFGDILLYELQERLSEFDPVYVIIGDHGEAFGEHSIYGHFFPSLYEENIHVPLVVSDDIDINGDPSDPISLVAVPSIIDQFAGDGDRLSMGKWAFASDYDGRNDRNLIAVRTKSAKQIATWTDYELAERTTFNLEADPSEQEGLPTDDDLHECLSSLVQRRYNHEEERRGIRSAVSTIT